MRIGYAGPKLRVRENYRYGRKEVALSDSAKSRQSARRPAPRPDRNDGIKPFCHQSSCYIGKPVTGQRQPGICRKIVEVRELAYLDNIFDFLYDAFHSL